MKRRNPISRAFWFSLFFTGLPMISILGMSIFKPFSIRNDYYGLRVEDGGIEILSQSVTYRSGPLESIEVVWPRRRPVYDLIQLKQALGFDFVFLIKGYRNRIFAVAIWFVWLPFFLGVFAFLTQRFRKAIEVFNCTPSYPGRCAVSGRWG